MADENKYVATPGRSGQDEDFSCDEVEGYCYREEEKETPETPPNKDSGVGSSGGSSAEKDGKSQGSQFKYSLFNIF